MKDEEWAECPHCGMDSITRETFLVTPVSMGFTTSRKLDVVYCHNCGATSSWMNWNDRNYNAYKELLIKRITTKIRDNYYVLAHDGNGLNGEHYWVDLKELTELISSVSFADKT